MISKTLSKWFCYLLILMSFNFVFSQSGGITDKELTESLKSYIDRLLVRHGQQNIEKERYLVQQIRMINEEIKSRVGNVVEKKAQYFDKLESKLAEVQSLKSRLPASGSQLYSFVEQLENKIRDTIDKGVMDSKRQRVFDDAIQLLYLAEELVKLDPSTNLNTNPQINERLSDASKKIVGTFGSPESIKSSSSGRSSATIFDVYKEWQRTERIKYHVRLTDVQVIKRRLIRNATVADLERMFKRELRYAAQAFNFGYYELADMSFDEILKVYDQVGELDDVQYYRAESNYKLGRFNKAEELFNKLINEYTASVNTAATYKRLIEITNHFERYDDALEHFRQMQNIVSTADENYEEALLLAINASLNGKYYQEAVSLSYEIAPESPLYNYAQFIQAKALAGARNFEEANTILQGILKTPNLEPQFRFDILAKVAFIYYELNQPSLTITYLEQINVNYSNYDRVVIGLAWAHYKRELELPNQKRNFENAKKYVNIIINDFANSEYALEAHALLGFINQLEFDTNSAINNFKYAYGAKEIKQLSDNLNTQEGELQAIVTEASRLERKALQKGDINAYNQAVQTREKVEKPLFKLKYADISPVGMAASNEVNRLRGQIDELERLKQKAIQKNEDAIVERIEEMQVKIYRAINSYPAPQQSILGFNYFDEHPLARKESVVQNENKKIQQMRKDTEQERTEIVNKIAQLDVQMYNARSRRDYKKLANLEISRERFVNLLDKMDYMDTYTYSMKMKTTNINLDHWSDYGAFGLANVNFALRSYQKDQIGLMLDQVQKINELLIKRKENIEFTIRQITNEISLMTRRVRKQERIREREDLTRQFEESYFDTHESEEEAEEEDNLTAPPSFDDEQ